MDEVKVPGLVDILILFNNKVEQTIDCVNSFMPSGQDIYVLNNGSQDKQLKKLLKTFRGLNNVHIHDAGKNLGVSAGRNFLIRQTTSPWLLSVDNDITIQPTEWLKLFSAFVEQNPGVEIVAPALFNLHEDSYARQLRVKLDDNLMEIETGHFPVTNCFPGGACFVKRTVFEKHGLFDEEMFVGFEDYEYALRALLSTKGSLEVYHVDTIELFHDHRYQRSSSDKQAVRLRYNEEKLKASYERLVQKYGIAFEHDWHWWTRNQVSVMTENPVIRRLKQFITRIRG